MTSTGYVLLNTHGSLHWDLPCMPSAAAHVALAQHLGISVWLNTIPICYVQVVLADFASLMVSSHAW